MLSEQRHSSRSPSESVKTDSVRTGPTNRLVSQQSHHSSISEEDDNENVPPAPPLPSNFGARVKSTSTSSSSTPTQSTPKPKTGGTNAAKIINAIAFQRPPAHRESSDEQKNSKRKNPNQTTTPSTSKSALQGQFGRVSARDIENEKPTFIYPSRSSQGKPNQSIFEKVNTHGGSPTYLGTGSFSQLEDCIRNCLSHSQTHTDYTNHHIKHDFSQKSLTRASVLEDYSYDGIIAPNHHITHSASSHDHHHHHQHHFSQHKKNAAELSLDEIRQVNDALAKYGIPILSHHEHPDHLYNKPRPVGDIISACQQLLADPLLRSQRDGLHAVQHAWDNLHYHSPQTNMYGYASPAVRGVASHLFNPPNQPPYDPVHSVASHLFSQPQQGSYNPGQGATSNLFGNPQQNQYNPGQSAVSNLFGNPQQNQYNPGPSAVSNLFGNPQQNQYNPGPNAASNPFGNPQQSSSSPGQSVLSRLFSGQPQQQQPQQNFSAPPFGTSFNQYPGNNQRIY